MDSLIEQGIDLIRCIEKTICTYHVKSSIHERLSWELVGLNAMVSQLQSQVPLTYNLKSTELKSQWGDAVSAELPELFAAVVKFRTGYETRKLNR